MRFFSSACCFFSDFSRDDCCCAAVSPAISLFVSLYKQPPHHTAWSKLNRINRLDFYLWKLIKQRGASSLLCNRLSGSAWLIQLHLSTVLTPLLSQWISAAILKTLLESELLPSTRQLHSHSSPKKTIYHFPPFTHLDSHTISCQTRLPSCISEPESTWKGFCCQPPSSEDLNHCICSVGGLITAVGEVKPTLRSQQSSYCSHALLNAISWTVAHFAFHPTQGRTLESSLHLENKRMASWPREHI